MAAPKGNQFWKARTKHGRDRLFSSADTLWDACCEYFQWVEDNPLYSDELVKFQGTAKHEPVARMRAMTIEGLCLFLDIDVLTWRRWRDVDDFCSVVARVESVIKSQKFAGAAADLLNPNIIARDLGLKDGVDHSSADGSMSPRKEPKEMTLDELREEARRRGLPESVFMEALGDSPKPE